MHPPLVGAQRVVVHIECEMILTQRVNLLSFQMRITDKRLSRVDGRQKRNLAHGWG